MPEVTAGGQRTLFSSHLHTEQNEYRIQVCLFRRGGGEAVLIMQRAPSSSLEAPPAPQPLLQEDDLQLGGG